MAKRSTKKKVEKVDPAQKHAEFMASLRDTIFPKFHKSVAKAAKAAAAAAGRAGDDDFVKLDDDGDDDAERCRTIAVVGLPLPALAARLVFRHTVFPLGRITQITGEEHVCKTPFMLEMLRWHIMHHGGGYLAENENKSQPELWHSFYYDDPELFDYFDPEQTMSVEDWQTLVSACASAARTRMDAKDGPGRVAPLGIAVDSVMGTSTRGTSDGVMKDGFAKRNYAEAANLITTYMGCLPRMMAGMPLSVIGVNHLKSSVENGVTIYRSPGGKSMKFAESFELRLVRREDIEYETKRRWRKTADGRPETVRLHGVNVRVKAIKNTLAESRYEVPLRFVWALDEEGRQKSWWDWHHSSIEYLVRLKAEKELVGLQNRVQDAVGLRDATLAKDGSVWSDVLGIPKSAPVSFHEAGLILESRPDVLQQLYEIFDIKQRAVFQPGVDYRQQMRDAARRETEEMLRAAPPPVEVPPEDESEGEE